MEEYRPGTQLTPQDSGGGDMGWLGYALLSALFAGLVAIFGKIGMRDIDSTMATMARSVVMALALISFVATQGRVARDLSQIPTRAWIFILLAGLAGAASWLFYFRALQIGPASKVAPIDRLSVIVTVACAALFLGERLSTGMAAGVALTVIGAVLIVRG
jgi:bacterial/archaeal transporter family protein